MEPFHFSCPHCSAHLRVRDPLSLGRHVDCPECGKYLLLAEEWNVEGKSELRVTAAPDPTPLKLDHRKSAQQGVTGKSTSKKSIEPLANPPIGNPARPASSATAEPRLTKHQSKAAPAGLPIPKIAWWRQPLTVAWVVTGTGAAALLAYIFLIAGSHSSTSQPPRGISGELPVVEENDIAGIADSDKPPGSTTTDVKDAVAQSQLRLERLGAILLDHFETESAFPPGTSANPNLPPEQRLSWQAMLAGRFDDSHPPVAWDHPWNDPLNDPFVRRRLFEFQNPAVAALTGGDGYPATHFVGVAGVGEDAARLSSDDPRAGVFGDDRRTKAADIRDGASNTWLVLGAREHLGSWAAGGRATVRPLTREPYVNGPDGFGTGAADSMLVLLADGSVRAVSAAADPRTLRGLATIADGLPANSSESVGEKSEISDRLTGPVGTLTPLTADSNGRDDQPLEPEFAPEPPRKRIDLAQSLRQPILLYDLPRARPLHEWLPGVADMIGAPIRYNDAELGTAMAGLKTPVRLRLENTTVGDILDELLRPAGLTFRVETDHIQLAPRR